MTTHCPILVTPKPVHYDVNRVIICTSTSQGIFHYNVPFHYTNNQNVKIYALLFLFSLLKSKILCFEGFALISAMVTMPAFYFGIF